MMQTVRDEKKARENAELEAARKLAASEDKIRDEVLQAADERYRLKLAEQDKKLSDTQKALEDAQRKASQGSQQNQGEVLELDLENRLREEFPFDDITEVKKGQWAPILSKPSAPKMALTVVFCFGKLRTVSGNRPGCQNLRPTSAKPTPVLASSCRRRFPAS